MSTRHGTGGVRTRSFSRSVTRLHVRLARLPVRLARRKVLYAGFIPRLLPTRSRRRVYAPYSGVIDVPLAIGRHRLSEEIVPRVFLALLFRLVGSKLALVQGTASFGFALARAADATCGSDFETPPPPTRHFTTRHGDRTHVHHDQVRVRTRRARGAIVNDRRARDVVLLARRRDATRRDATARSNDDG